MNAKKNVAKIISKWKHVNVKEFAPNGDIIKTYTESIESAITWHQDPDVTVRIFSGGIVEQSASVGITRWLTEAK